MGSGQWPVEEGAYLTLDEIHRETLAMLCRAGEWFGENGIRYSLAYGTLLGAVRHQGFIPWDDDVDIYMPRPDFERWLARPKEFTDATGYKVCSSRDGSLFSPVPKFVNPRIRAQEGGISEDVHKEFLWVDVFPVDGIVPGSKELKAYLRRRYVRLMLMSVVLYKGSGPIKSVAKGVLRPLISRLVDVQLLNERTDLEARRISLGESDRVGCLFEGCKLGTTSFPRKGFEQMVELPFEGTMQPCMSCWDEYLTNRYGDYMTLPPEGERRDHGIKAWRV